MKKPSILMTNDDGIDSNGLRCLWEALKEAATIQIAAPMIEQSGAGVGVTFNRAIETKSVEDYPHTKAWKIDGKPADCVKIALNTLLDDMPDFIISGINHGSNAGRNVLYSGTVGAIIEGVMRGIPGIAFSYLSDEVKTFPHVQPYILKIFHYVLEHPLPKGTLLNVNFPHTPPDQIKGCKMARQGLRYFMGMPLENRHPDGHPQFSFGWDEYTFDEHDESDIALLDQGYVTAVPLSVGELTDYGHLGEKKQIFDDHFFLL